MAEQLPFSTPGIEGSTLPGPFAVGRYARALQAELRKRARVQLMGEVFNVRTSRTKKYFELRDADGAVPCSMWRSDFEKLRLPEEALRDGVTIVVAGGPDYYPGTATSSPAFSFAVGDLRIAGEGDLLAQVERLRRMLDAEGLMEPQKRLQRKLVPRTIGVVTGEGGKARDDVLAGLARRGWRGTVVWAFAPVQDRHAAPRIARALQDLAAVGSVDVIVVARGGGSLADLMGFCDETLCRTVAMLSVPVISSVGHHTDRTLIDDVAAVACSTPTHAAEAAVPLDCGAARQGLVTMGRRLRDHSRQAVLGRARTLQRLARAPAEHVGRQRRRVHQLLREMRAGSRRQVASGRTRTQTYALVLSRKTGAAQRAETGARRARLDALASALAAHDPGRVLERGYALVEDPAGAVVTSAEQARSAGAVRLSFADDAVNARIEGE